MTAEERYEWAWKRYFVRLNENSKIRLASFLREIHVYQRGMGRWMYAKGLSVIPEETRFSSGRMLVPNGQPCSIR